MGNDIDGGDKAILLALLILAAIVLGGGAMARGCVRERDDRTARSFQVCVQAGNKPAECRGAP